MAMFHCSIKIIGRSKGRSAIASAAYRSGERLYNAETGLIHDFTRKGGVVMSEEIQTFGFLPLNKIAARWLAKRVVSLNIYN